MSYLPYRGIVPEITPEQFNLIASASKDIPLMDVHDWSKAWTKEVQRRIGCEDGVVQGYMIAYFAAKKTKQEAADGQT